MKAGFLIIGIFFLSYTVAGQNTLPKQTDSLFQALYKYGQFNGNVLIAGKGKVIYKRSFGFSDINNKILNSDSSAFTLGSVSKTLTSAAILQLKEKGKLKLNDSFTKHFPGFPYPEITIRNLLTHTSGLPDYELYEDEMKKNPAKIFTIHDILPSLQTWKKPLYFKPGEKWQYANTNFCLLALLVEKISGMTFQQYMDKFIFKPAKMHSTYFQSDPKNTNRKNKTIITNTRFSSQWRCNPPTVSREIIGDHLAPVVS